MQTKQAMGEDDDISLLEDSQASPNRDDKKHILEEQKRQRKRSEAERRQKEADELKKLEDAKKALELRFKSQTKAF